MPIVYDTDGYRVGHARTGRSREMERLFVDAVRQAQQDGPCYVAVGIGAPAEFVESLYLLDVAVVWSEALGRSAMVCAGEPVEWRQDVDGHLPGCAERGGRPFCDPDCAHYDGWLERIG